jgi:putative acetyltransferase
MNTPLFAPSSAVAALRVTESGLDDARVIAALGTHLARSRAETAPGSAHALDLSGLRAPDIRFWTAWDDEAPLGCGALRQLSPTDGKVKSMHVAETARRRGVGSALLRTIIAAARGAGMERLNLETGSWDYFRPAVALHRVHGFVVCGPFGDYREDPNSVFMTLDLRPPGGNSAKR